MMDMKKRILAMLLAVVMVILSLPAFVIPVAAQTGTTPNCLCFTAEAEDSSVTLTKEGHNGYIPSVSLSYSTDGGVTWMDYTVGATILLPNAGDKMYLKAKEENQTFAVNDENYHKFVLEGKVAASGNIMTLLNAYNPSDTIPSDYCFKGLFEYNEGSLTTPPDLPATTLKTSCYNTMFYNCTALRSTPILPATTLAEDCYYCMFGNCKALQSPVYALCLPATNLPKECYSCMFWGSNITFLNEEVEGVDTPYSVRFPAENDAESVGQDAMQSMTINSGWGGQLENRSDARAVSTPEADTTYFCSHYSHVCTDEIVPVLGKGPTCTQNGFDSCWKCPVCGKFFLDEDGETVLSDYDAWKAEGGDGYLPALSHIDENHDNECDRCGSVRATYLDYNETTGKVDIEREVWDVFEVVEPKYGFRSGWNIIKGNVVFEDRIEILDNVNLILADGATLTAKKGISWNIRNNLSIYAQSNDKDAMGKLVVPGAETYCAGIGADGGGICGSIAIYGGNVTATGGLFGAGIGGSNCGICGNITIRGGIVTVQGGQSGAGIGGGDHSSVCGAITISGGIVTAQGGESGAGIGSGGYGSTCGAVTLSGGYIKATAGQDAVPIGAGYEAFCGSVSVAKACTSVTDGSTRYINYMIPGTAPTCTDAGNAACYFDPLNEIYYSDVSFAADKYIGDAEAFATWKAQGGGGYVAPLGHDWQFVDETLHKCARCEVAAAHTYDGDFICDDCDGPLIATAIAVTKAQGEAKAELVAAVGEKPSDTLASILNHACTEVDAALTLDAVAAAKEQGLSDVETQKATELEARKAEYLPGCERILESDEYSDAVKAIAREFVRGLNAAETLKDIDNVVDMYAPALGLRMARDHWVAELEGLLPEKPSATVTSIVEDACELIENGEDMWVFSYVFDIASQAVERQLAAEANQKALEDLLAREEENLADAKLAAKAALTEAAGEDPSDAVQTILDDACDEVDKAETIREVQTAEETGFAAIMTKLAAEAAEKADVTIEVIQAKGEAKEALTAALGENVSIELKEIYKGACKAVEEASTLQDVAAAKERGLSDMEAQKEAEFEETRDGLLATCEMILASDKYSENVKALVLEFKEVLNAAEDLLDVERALNHYGPAINLQDDRERWLSELEGLLPENPSDAVLAIVEDARELILFGTDTTVFDNVFDAAHHAVERQLTAEANQKAMEAVLRQTEEDLAKANTAMDELNGTIKDKEATIAEKQEALTAVTSQLNTAKADLETANAEIKAGQAKIEELTGTVAEKDEALKQAEQGVKEARERLEQAEQKIEVLQAMIEVLKPQVLEAAKDAAKGMLVDAAGENPSDAVKAIADEYIMSIDKAETTEDVVALAEAGLEAIAVQKAAEQPDPTEPDTGIGDANGDGAVDMKDVLMIRKFLAGLSAEINQPNADVNADKNLDMKDVLMLRKFLANLIEKLGA